MDWDDDDTVDELPPRPRQAITPADRELLGLAARAIGAARVEDVDGEQWLILHFADGTTANGWNPLVHSDDAFNLAVDCGIDLHFGADFARADAAGINEIEEEFTRDDRSADRAATRRAVTRVAAEIGKKRP